MSDSISKTWQATSNVNEQVGVGQIDLNQVNYIRTLLDQASITDWSSLFTGKLVDVLESLSVVDVAILQSIYGKSISEPITVSDLTNMAIAMEKSETVTLSDVLSILGISGKTASEVLTISDLALLYSIFHQTPTDQISLTDNTSIAKSNFVSVTEQITLSDLVTRVSRLGVIILESLSINDGMSFPARWNFRTKHTNVWSSPTKHTNTWTFRTKNSNP